MKALLNYIGLWIEESNSNPYSYQISDYINTDKERVNAHKELLKEIERKEESRLEIIDTKTSQIVTYTGIIFSALSLFIPILLDKITDQGLIVKILFIMILISAFVFYILTIHNAIRNYNVLKFSYSGSHPNNAIKYQDKSVAEFGAIEVQDLLYSINQNLKTNNSKASNLIYAYRAFRIANIMTALLGILICVSLLFIKGKKDTTSNSIKIENLIQK
jgi:hypothetical protein